VSYQLDTDTCVHWLRGKDPALKARLTALTPSDVQISAVVRGELLVGAERSADPRATREDVLRFLDAFEVAPVDADVARHYALLRAGLEKRGESIGPNDLWIAATALAWGATLVTGNTREFRRVPRLHLENWLGR
jgi:tRNA(fMet)-specific endonuclease VapC